MGATMDEELINDFIAEVKTLHLELKVILNAQLKTPKMDKALFEKFGQLIDRIYGTSTTMGYAEIGKYLYAVKSVSYLSSQCDREVGQKKALRMMMDCVDYIEKIHMHIRNKDEMKNLYRLFVVEIAKAERMSKTEFQNITRKSVA
jgi:hypothetical protein